MLTTYDEFVNDQIQYGGKKYAHSNDREVTDVLTDIYGVLGLLWTIHKYVYRFYNVGREKDLLKIGAYMYILWLKYGFHLAGEPAQRLYDTNVRTKEAHFGQFVDQVNTWANDVIPAKVDLELTSTREKLDTLLASLKYFKHRVSLLQIYFMVRDAWNTTFRASDAHETDTWGDEKFKKESSG